jgi:hypothetical protein
MGIMRGKPKFAAAVLLTIVTINGCEQAAVGPPQTNCGDDDPRIGQTAVLTNNSDHDVSGVATIIDNCTIEIENFTYDGTALDARVAGIHNNDLFDRVLLTEKLPRHEGETLTVTLPEGVTLDDVQHIAVVCAPFYFNFGDGYFE